MRRRLYFVLPGLESAHRTANDLLLARVEDRNMAFLARRGTDLGELREASYVRKTDMMHGAGVGLSLGGLAGLILGMVIVVYPPGGTEPELGAVFIATLVGALLGAWIGSMAGASVANTDLKRFARDIDEGRILLMVDVAYRRIEEVNRIVRDRHPEAVPAGQEAHVPAFP